MPEQFETIIEGEESRYSRQAELELITDQNIGIVGCGGVGSWVAYFLAKAGIRGLTIFDSDVVSLSNLHRLPLQDDSIGRTKSEAIRDLCLAANPGNDVNYEARTNFKLELHDDLIGTLDYVVCSTDSLKSRKMVYDAVKERVRYCEVGAEGNRGSVTMCPPEFSTDKENVDGYEITPVFVGPCVIAAAMATYYILRAKTPSTTWVVDWDQNFRDHVHYGRGKLFFKEEQV